MDLHTFQNFFPLRSNSETSSTNNKDSNDYSPIAKKQNQTEARDRDRNCQINGSHEEIFSVYEHILRTNIRSLVRSNQKDKVCFYLLEVHYNGRMRLIRSQFATGCN